MEFRHAMKESNKIAMHENSHQQQSRVIDDADNVIWKAELN